VRIACVALAGTIGAVGMLGHRRGGVTELLAAGGHALIPAAPQIGAVMVGTAILALWLLMWSAMTAAAMQRTRGQYAAVIALLVAAVALAASLVVPDAIGGPTGTLTTAERTLVHGVLAVSLLLGMRLAPPG
jgi:hypothetical protein